MLDLIDSFLVSLSVTRILNLLSSFLFNFLIINSYDIFNDFVVNRGVILAFICLKLMFTSVSSSVCDHTVGTSLYTLRSDVAFLLSHSPNLIIFLLNISGWHFFPAMLTSIHFPVRRAHEYTIHSDFTVLRRCW